jgi:hypothetical protein
MRVMYILYREIGKKASNIFSIFNFPYRHCTGGAAGLPRNGLLRHYEDFPRSGGGGGNAARPVMVLLPAQRDERQRAAPVNAPVTKFQMKNIKYKFVSVRVVCIFVVNILLYIRGGS